MSISPISFGKKVPMGKCKIKDIQQNKAVDAFLYELDCKDYSDIETIEKLGKGWGYKENILNIMRYKALKANSKLDITHIYIMENNDGNIICLSEARNTKPALVLDYLEAKSGGKYKYIGQNMLAFLSKLALKNKFKEIYVPIPVQKAYDWYIKKCGFKKAEVFGDALKLSWFGMKKLQYKVK